MEYFLPFPLPLYGIMIVMIRSPNQEVAAIEETINEIRIQ